LNNAGQRLDGEHRESLGGKCMIKAREIRPRLLRGGGGEEGQALVEYALILALLTIFCMGALSLVGANVASFLNLIASSLGTIVAGS
jgi:Flp pilus assembly pilin Flp